jgi:hypothetical protein
MPSCPRSWLVTRFVNKSKSQVLPVEQDLFPPYGAPEFTSIFSGDRVAQSLVFSLQYLVDYVSSCYSFPLHIEFSVIFALRLPCFEHLDRYAVSAHNLHGLRCSSSFNTSISVGNYYVKWKLRGKSMRFNK